MTTTSLSVFDGTEEYPNPDARRRLASLVGIDDQRQRLGKGLRLMLEPESVTEWSKKHYRGKVLPVVAQFQQRPPLFLLAGDVGTGKTALAESIGDSVAKSTGVHVTLYRMSLGSRGSGLVGEMTNLITGAFTEVTAAAKKSKSASGQHRGAHILLVDEADTLAQSRESVQMHHEDRAGVNALIRGINELSLQQLPAAVIMCTNRLDAMDPAVRRRAADVLEFTRPNEEHRRKILHEALSPAGFDAHQIDALVKATGADSHAPGYTFSDLTQRFLPSLVLDAFPDSAITFDRALELVVKIKPTPPFGKQQ
jgi:SpoVK/Ycf46/Vps4 family AAA+-type ATPase